MAYRKSSRFHKIRHVDIKQREGYPPSANFFITLTKETAEKFAGNVLVETITEQGILLTKSGCSINVQPVEIKKTTGTKYFKRI